MKLLYFLDCLPPISCLTDDFERDLTSKDRFDPLGKQCVIVANQDFSCHFSRLYTLIAQIRSKSGYPGRAWNPRPACLPSILRLFARKAGRDRYRETALRNTVARTAEKFAADLQAKSPRRCRRPESGRYPAERTWKP